MTIANAINITETELDTKLIILLGRLYHKRKGKSTRMQKNPTGVSRLALLVLWFPEVGINLCACGNFIYLYGWRVNCAIKLVKPNSEQGLDIEITKIANSF